MAEWGKNTQMLNNDELSHHGILGMKWGVRRYQNKDGSLTAAGRKHYGYGEKMTADASDSSVTKKVKSDYNNLSDQEFMNKYHVSKSKYRKRVNKYGDPYMNSPLAKEGKKLAEKNERKEALKDAYETRNLATTYSTAAKQAKKRMDSYDVKGNSAREKAAKETYNYFSKEYQYLQKEATRKTNDIIKKYGDRSIKPIKYGKEGEIKENNVSAGKFMRGLGLGATLGLSKTSVVRLKDGSQIVLPSINPAGTASSKARGRMAETSNYRSRLGESNWLYIGMPEKKDAGVNLIRNKEISTNELKDRKFTREEKKRLYGTRK